MDLLGNPTISSRRPTVSSPFEVKSRPYPKTGPRVADLMQLMTYCVLVEDKLRTRPPHGIIAYADRYDMVPYTPQQRETVLNLVNEIAGAEACAPHRNHRQHARCDADTNRFATKRCSTRSSNEANKRRIW
jgi:CRISPR/Cas system-associated exonuclease Cas4 (RecB family)